MAPLAIPLMIVGAAVSFMGTIAQSNALKQQAEAEQQAANYKAAEEQRLGQQQVASAQRTALDEKRKSAYVQSRLQAVSAASGGGASDPTVIKLSSDIAAQGEYNALSALYSGQSQNVALQNQANLDIYTGAAKASALRSQADYTLLGGIGGLAGSLGKINFG
jgi:hypothetical protein